MMNNDLADAGAGPHILIREADESQILDIVSIGEKTFARSWNEQMVAASLYNTYDRILVAVDQSQGDMLVGYCIFSVPNEDCELLQIAVTGSYRKRNIASHMVQKMLRICAEEEGRHMFLEVRQSNTAAIRLYMKYGFEEISRRKHYYSEPEEDAVIMKLENITGIKI
jgi:ribosomal-protein-alanine N-acetyltransferase